jgi:DNA-binding transcriptional regulator YbjK
VTASCSRRSAGSGRPVGSPREHVSGRPRVDRRARRRAETRAKLIEAARATFARQGVDATRINEITDEADLGFGSFYNYFDSKDAIVAAVVEEVVTAAGEAIAAATEDIEDPARWLRWPTGRSCTAPLRTPTSGGCSCVSRSATTWCSRRSVPTPPVT